MFRILGPAMSGPARSEIAAATSPPCLKLNSEACVPAPTTVNAIERFLSPLALKPGSPVVSSLVVRCVFGVSHGPPCQLERLFAPFARDLPGCLVSGDVGYRKSQLQSDQPQDRPSHQICQS